MQQTGILRTVNGYLNGATAVGDPFPGTSVLGYTGQVPFYLGQLGAFEFLNFSGAQKLSDPVITPSLQSGRYQYVQFAADGTAYLYGQVLYWKDETNYIVTNVSSATATTVAGVSIAPVTQGNYWFVQTDGVAPTLFGATTTLVAGQAVYTSSSGANTASAVVDATPINAGGATTSGTTAPEKFFLGQAKTTIVASTVILVYLKGIVQVQ